MKPTRSHALISLTLVFAVLFLGASGLALAQDPTPPAGSPAAEPLAPAITLGTAASTPLSTGFTYQGRLADGGNPANGAYDFQFKLFDAASGGTQIGSTVSKNDWAVSSGLFTTDLDFGAGAFDGQARWLEVAVRPGASTGIYTTLAPRRALLASPYAMYSGSTRGIAVASDGRVGIGTSDPNTSNLRIQGANPIGTRLFIGNSGNGEASITMDASDGDFAGQDYGWIAQYDNLDVVIGNGAAERITVKPDGKVGIGTAAPRGLLNVSGSSSQSTDILVSNSGGGGAYIGMDAVDGNFQGQDYAWIAQYHNKDLAIGNGVADRITIKPDGRVGIGTAAPQGLLNVSGSSSQSIDIEVGNSGSGGAYISMDGVDGDFHGQDYAWIAQYNNKDLAIRNGVADRITIKPDGRVGIGTDSPKEKLDVAGTTRTDVLQIDAGADLAERFRQSGDTAAEPGTVMVIDAANPGHLKVSDAAYDTKVAGIVSGAGDVKPGLTLSQEGVMEGDLTVAMAGRVYARCKAISSPIQPGDLLTTSDVPGHCMKAIDLTRMVGTLLGKAMTGLAEGTGLVLVLVNLQ